MNKEQYLDTDCVSEFVDYLVDVINGHVPINHGYVIRDRRLPGDYADYHRDGRFEVASRQLKLTCLEDAFNAYFWKSEGFAANRKKLLDVKSLFQRARHCAAAERQEHMLAAIKKCMEWGFGLGRPAYVANVAWAMERRENVYELIDGARFVIESGTPNLSVFGKEAKATHRGYTKVRMNAGYTKVYALACDHSIIYDGRVGGALGYLVRRFCEARGKTLIPEALHFRWMQGESGQNRDPSGNGFVFKQLRPGNDRKHAELNIKANWILNKAISKATARWCQGEAGLHRLEAALFMIGYTFPAVEAT